ncbi:MAG: glycosyltransferase [Nitrospira sp.]|nr:glycosyltransferase [Nitrospira sp.]
MIGKTLCETRGRRDRPSIVLAGPRQDRSGMGGVVVLFEDLCREMPNVATIDTNAKNYSHQVAMTLRFVLSCIKAALRGKTVALHGTARDFQYLGLILLAFSLLFGLRYHTRKFAGDFDKFYEALPKFWRWTTRHYLRRSDVNFFETQHLTQYFSEFNPRTEWFPNYRPDSSYLTPNTFTGRFVYLGQVRKEKGIEEVLSLDGHLPEGWTIDVYGPLMGYSQNSFPGVQIHYKGTVEPSCVPRILSQYNGLLLFSTREGYPGVLIEAFSVGLPVIVTNLPTIREMVAPSCGELLEFPDREAVLKAMQKVEVQYSDKRTAAKYHFSTFRKDVVLSRYFSRIGLDVQGAEE